MNSSPVTQVPTQRVYKRSAAKDLSEDRKSALAKYRDFFVGQPGLMPLVRFEVIMLIAGARSGAIGFLLRKVLFSRVIGRSGKGVQWGRNVSLRHPFKMQIGDGTAIDDGCLLDARGVQTGDFRIGSQVIIARNVAIQSKTDFGTVEIGDHCSIGNNCTLSSAGGIRLGSHVMLAGHCYVGGGRYQIDREDIPMIQQPLYSKGIVDIGSDCWLGAGVRVLDGATIGTGSVIGAGALVTGSIPPSSIAVGVPARVIGTRKYESAPPLNPTNSNRTS